MVRILQILVCLFYISILIVESLNDGINITDLSECNIDIEQVGCFDDRVKKRVLKEEVLNSRDKNSPVYMPPDVADSWENYVRFLANFVCECAKRVSEEKRGPYFGIQFYAECWSGHKEVWNAGTNLKKYGEDNAHCIDGEFNQYTGKKKYCGVYAGINNANYIYRLRPHTENSCPEYFKPLGCFHDNLVPPRPLPRYLMNERDKTVWNWNGKMIDWKNWKSYMPSFMCRCALAAKKNNFTYFGLQYYGECWGGNDKLSISKNGKGAPEDCITQDLGQCPSIDDQEELIGCLPYPCVGEQMTNYVYELIQGPLGCASNPCRDGKSCKPRGLTKYDCVTLI